MSQLVSDPVVPKFENPDPTPPVTHSAFEGIEYLDSTRSGSDSRGSMRNLSHRCGHGAAT